MTISFFIPANGRKPYGFLDSRCSYCGERITKREAYWCVNGTHYHALCWSKSQVDVGRVGFRYDHSRPRMSGLLTNVSDQKVS